MLTGSLEFQGASPSGVTQAQLTCLIDPWLQCPNAKWKDQFICSLFACAEFQHPKVSWCPGLHCNQKACGKWCTVLQIVEEPPGHLTIVKLQEQSTWIVGIKLQDDCSWQGSFEFIYKVFQISVPPVVYGNLMVISSSLWVLTVWKASWGKHAVQA